MFYLLESSLYAWVETTAQAEQSPYLFHHLDLIVGSMDFGEVFEVELHQAIDLLMIVLYELV